jgi:response regulator RpfG family c-di-GMP phosphodiesterase
MRDLRSTLDRLARAALRPEDPTSVDTLVEEAVRLTGSAPASGPETVRDALLAVARSLDTADPAMIGHGDRVGLLARRLAEQLGSDREEVGTIELAARLHGLDVAHARELAAVPSLRRMGEILDWHPSEASGPPPLGTQVLAIANAYDSLITAGPAERRGRRDVLEQLRDMAGDQWSAEVVEALARIVSVPPRSAHRRRRADADANASESDAA